MRPRSRPPSGRPTLPRLLALPLLVLSCLLTASPARAEPSDAIASFRTSCAPRCTQEDIFGQAGEAARARGDKEAADADARDRSGRSREDVANHLGRDRDQLESQLARTPEGPEKQALLARPYQPPKELKALLPKENIATSRDLISRGKEVEKQLRETAQAEHAQAANLRQQAEKSRASAAEYHRLLTQAQLRRKSMLSLEGSRAAANTRPGSGSSRAAGSGGQGEQNAGGGRGKGAEGGASARVPAGSALAPGVNLERLGGLETPSWEKPIRSGKSSSSNGVAGSLNFNHLLGEPEAGAARSPIDDFHLLLRAMHGELPPEEEEGAATARAAGDANLQSSNGEPSPDVSLFDRIHRALRPRRAGK